MTGKQLLTVGAVVLVACFGGAFAALQASKFFDKKQDPSPIFVKGDTLTAIPVQNSAAAPDFRAASKRILESVVSIDTQSTGEDFFGRRIRNSSSGSGVVVSQEGYIVTNNHVVTDRGRLVDRLAVTFANGESVEGKIIGHDPRSDLAVIKVEKSGLKPIEIGDSDSLEIGEWLIAAGNPFGYHNTISVGVVSSKGRPLTSQDSAIFVDGIQTDAAINPGNSGGALCDSTGRLVGINVAIASQGGGSNGIGFAIPVNRMKQVVDDIVKTGAVQYGDPGFTVRQDSGLILGLGRYRRQLMQAVNTTAEPPQQGVIVADIRNGGSAAKAGLQPLDILLAVNGKPLKELGDYQVFIADKRPGEKVEFKVWSAGKEKTVSLQLSTTGSLEEENVFSDF